MKDGELLERRLAHVVTSVDRLRTLVKPADVLSDPVRRGFAERYLQTAIQAMIDVAAGIVTELRLREPGSNAQLFDLLAEAGWVPAASVPTYRRIVGFRNVVVHGYLDVDPEIVRDILESHLEDLLSFVRYVRDRRAGPQGGAAR